MSRHPRAVQEIMQGEVMILLTGEQALDRLTLDCKFPEDRARRVLNIAWEFGQKAEPCPGGYVHVWYHGKDDTGHYVFSVVEHIGPEPERKALALPDEKRYTQHRQPATQQPKGAGKDKTMARTAAAPATARRGRKPAPEPEPEQNGEVDLARYVAKPLTPTMEDFVEWFEDNVAELKTLSRDRILYLGVTLYSHFQKSDFNVERREERRAARSAPEPEPEPEPEPARRGRKPAAATTAAGNGTPARRGRKPAAAAEPEPATPARRGRKPAAAAAKPATTTRRGGRKPAAATDEEDGDAPF